MVVSPLPPAAAPALSERPRLLFFYSSVSGRCRRAEGFLAQVLQRRRNHDTFTILRVPIDERPEVAERFGVHEVPALVVVQGSRIVRRIVAPAGCRSIERQLADWLH
ncbi:MAG TPA: thioredoxin family protein [Gaiellaceae bacterium]|nr:thioredoxin family protein [Gaiellaceae bacterium]